MDKVLKERIQEICYSMYDCEDCPFWDFKGERCLADLKAGLLVETMRRLEENE